MIETLQELRKKTETHSIKCSVWTEDLKDLLDFVDEVLLLERIYFYSKCVVEDIHNFAVPLVEKSTLQSLEECIESYERFRQTIGLNSMYNTVDRLDKLITPKNNDHEDDLN